MVRQTQVYAFGALVLGSCLVLYVGAEHGRAGWALVVRAGWALVPPLANTRSVQRRCCDAAACVGVVRPTSSKEVRACFLQTLPLD